MRAQIVEASRAAGVTSDQLAPVRLTQYRRVLRQVLDSFTTFGKEGKDRLWLWEGFREPSYALPVEPGHVLLPLLFPAGERVWLITEDREGQKEDGNFWVFEGETGAIQAILAELFLFEYYVVDKRYTWLLCENHHNVLIGVGQPIVERLKALVSS